MVGCIRMFEWGHTIRMQWNRGGKEIQLVFSFFRCSFHSVDQQVFDKKRKKKCSLSERGENKGNDAQLFYYYYLSQHTQHPMHAESKWWEGWRILDIRGAIRKLNRFLFPSCFHPHRENGNTTLQSYGGRYLGFDEVPMRKRKRSRACISFFFFLGEIIFASTLQTHIVLFPAKPNIFLSSSSGHLSGTKADFVSSLRSWVQFYIEP